MKSKRILDYEIFATGLAVVIQLCKEMCGALAKVFVLIGLGLLGWWFILAVQNLVIG